MNQLINDKDYQNFEVNILECEIGTVFKISELFFHIRELSKC